MALPAYAANNTFTSDTQRLMHSLQYWCTHSLVWVRATSQSAGPACAVVAPVAPVELHPDSQPVPS